MVVIENPKRFTMCGIGRLGFSMFFKGGEEMAEELKRWRTRSKPEIIVGEYTTANYKFNISDDKLHQAGTILYMNPDNQNVELFNSTVSGKGNYDLYILLEDVKTSSPVEVCVVASGNVNVDALYAPESSGDSQKLTELKVDECTIYGWLGNKFTLHKYQGNDNYIPDDL